MRSNIHKAYSTQFDDAPQSCTAVDNGKARCYSAEPYKYAPLRHDDEIRLLRIASRKHSSRSAALKASIRHVYLSDSPLYTAVSWRWGPQEDLVDLEISGRVLRIQANLARILSDLQDQHQPRHLWVDAVCIDQNSNDERNHQVQLMGRIYNEANYVIACLMAERQQDQRRLARTAKTVHEKFQQRIQGSIAFKISTASRLSSEYQLFFENLYFTRRWIIQEVIQARSVTLCCEGYQMPMSVLENMFDRDAQAEDEEQEHRASGYMKDLMNSGAMRLCRLRREMDRDLLPLEQLLYTHEAAKCTDFRDRVYALLSLTQHAKDHLPVDYDVGRAELMLSVVNVCSSYENLSPFRTLSFTCFLRQHLRVEAYDIRHTRLHPPPSTANTTVTLRGIVRGTIATHRVSAQVENAAQRVRNDIPSLSALGKIVLQHCAGARAPLEIVRRRSSRPSENEMHTRVSGVDQCLFTFASDDSRRSSRTYRERPVIAGLASKRVDPGDEIWQFERTPLAVVARPTQRGYDLIGRAYLLQKLSTGRHIDRSARSRPSRSRLLEDDLIWVDEASLHGKKTPLIEVDVRGLLKLMTWVTYDE